MQASFRKDSDLKRIAEMNCIEDIPAFRCHYMAADRHVRE